MIDLNAIVIAVIGAIVSIYVARFQAKSKAHEVTEGLNAEIKDKITNLQNTADLQAARLNKYTVTALERDELKDKLQDVEREIKLCPCTECPLRNAREVNK